MRIRLSSRLGQKALPRRAGLCLPLAHNGSQEDQLAEFQQELFKHHAALEAQESEIQKISHRQAISTNVTSHGPSGRAVYVAK